MTAADHSSPAHKQFWTLFLGCIGVVYGDIGTSPLYALRETLHLVRDGGVTPVEILGIVSLIIWALILVVTIKYIFFIMRADNRGEGGALSLMALAIGALGKGSRYIILLGIIGAALFYGDAMLTPAISVLSAVEGLKLVSPKSADYVIPLTILILVCLFSVQSRGTGKVALFFGPITLIWFLTLGACGMPYIIAYPEVLQAFLPTYGMAFLIEHHGLALAVLGAVFLAVTGAEALYADMGHFGKKPIRYAWMLIVFPCLVLNYLGQAGLIIHKPEALDNPFFLLAPEWGLIPLVILATAATVIASQAVITGAFSLTQQAIQLGLLPRFAIRHTSETQMGQIFLPQINFLLLIGVLILVMEFGSSSALASAYGIAVSGTMMVTSTLAFLVFWKVWKKPLWMALPIFIPFLMLDSTFVLANLMKLMEGGYIPLLLAAGVIVVMWTWRRGSKLLSEKTHKENIPLTDLVKMLERSSVATVPGTAVFLTSEPGVAPTALMHNLKHNKVLHETIVIMTVRVAPTPYVREENRIIYEPVADRIFKVTIRFGYTETPDIPKVMTQCRKEKGLKFDIMSTSFFLGRRIIKPSPASGMPLWQDNLYILLARNATNATEFFHIPQGRVVELGSQITI